MSTQRDELAAEIADVYLSNMGAGPLAGKVTQFDLAEAILAAGYRKPRTITEYYGDEGIESLPCGSVILAGITTSTLQSDGTWLDSWGITYDFYELNLPATVLHEPTA